MTVGQWLLEFFWNDTQLLIDFSKRGGVIMAAIGALVAAPDGFKAWLIRGVAKIRVFPALWLRLRQLFRPPSQTARPYSIPSELRIGGSLNLAPGLHWEEGADDSKKVGWLKDEVVRLEAKLRTDIAALVGRDKQHESDLLELRDRLTDDINRLQRQLDEKEAKTAQIDALGLLPITSGIVLSGIPEDVASWGVTGWITWFAAAGSTLFAVVVSWKKGHWHSVEENSSRKAAGKPESVADS